MKERAAFPNVENSLDLVARDIDADFLRRAHGERIKGAGIEAGALALITTPAKFIHPSRRQLAARCCARK